MQDVLIPSAAIVVVVFTFFGKIIYDWLKNGRTPPTSIRGPVNGSSISHPFEAQIKLCNTQFADIRKEFERGNNRFEKIEEKLDHNHHEVMAELLTQNKRLTIVEAKIDNR